MTSTPPTAESLAVSSEESPMQPQPGLAGTSHRIAASSMPSVSANSGTDHNKDPVHSDEKQVLTTSSTPHHAQGHGPPVDQGILSAPSLRNPTVSSSVESNIGNQKHPTFESDKEQNCDTIPRPQKLTGWAAVEKTFTDYDKQEIEGYKEDIDSLLTFTGLYSGVLTAFVIVSFTQLQPDTAGETLTVLRFIANQTAGNAISGGHLMDPTPPPSVGSSSFQPSVTAIRVNILWFASLVISLSTASFAILVKQWLRAYMAYTSSSPQGQMRIRFLRRSGLDAWRVLGIASILPLLLQVSLALFFVGLCFFTSDIHPAIGNTTIPLVSAWAFLFIAVTLSPICSTRCPFKTPALAPITTNLRTRIYVPFIMPWVHPGRLTFALLYVVFFAVALPTIGPLTGLWHFVSLVFPAANLSHQKWTDMLQRILHPTLHWLHAGLRRYKPRICWEEKEVSRDRSSDLMILASADTTQDNPELDSALIEATLDQIQPHCSEALELLVNIIGNRIPLAADFEEGPEGVEIDMKLLSKNTQEAIQRIFSRHVTSALVGGSGGQTTGHWKAGAWAISMFFSIHGYGPWDSDPPEPISWTYIHQWLCTQCQPQADLANGPQLLLWVCSYISRVRHEYTTERDLNQDMDILKHAITVSANRTTELCCGQPADSVLGPLAIRTARRLMESADSLRPDCDRTYDAVILALKLCGVVHSAGYSIDCADLLGVRLRDVISRRTQAQMQHKEMVATWISLPPGYVEHYIAELLCEYRFDGDDYISITDTIGAIAKAAIVKDTTASQLLNLSLIVLSLERSHVGNWIQFSLPTGELELPDWLRMFQFIANALAKERPRNIYRRNSFRLDNGEIGVAKTCWRGLSAMLGLDDNAESVAAPSTSTVNSGRASGDLYIARLPTYMNYFLVELLTYFIAEKEFLPDGYSGSALWKEVNKLSMDQRDRIRKEGEQSIGIDGGEATRSAGGRILRSIQHTVFHSRWPNNVL